jgi:hypothetical protein
MARQARRWPQDVTDLSDALDLEENVFAQRDPTEIAATLMRSAEHSDRRRRSPFRSATSMLTFYANRAGTGLPKTQKAVLEDAKDELRRQFGRA